MELALAQHNIVCHVLARAPALCTSTKYDKQF